MWDKPSTSAKAKSLKSHSDSHSPLLEPDAPIDNLRHMDQEETPTTSAKARILSLKSSLKKDKKKHHSNKAADVAPRGSTDTKYLLCEDTDYEGAPQHLLSFLQQFDVAKLSTSEVLFLLIYVVAVECGFYNKNLCKQLEKSLERLQPISSFNIKNIRQICRHRPQYTAKDHKSIFSMNLCSLAKVQQSNPPVLDSLLSAMVTGDFMIVTLTFNHKDLNASGQSVCLSIGRYVLSGYGEKDQPIYKNLGKVKELSTILRENLFGPIRNKQLEALGASVYPGLEGLPSELYDEIFQYLGRKELRIVAKVSKALEDSVKNSRFLKKM